MTEQMEPEPDVGHNQWQRVGLGGARWICTFRTPKATADAAAFLIMDEHGHHFAVVGEGKKIIMSKMATECLIAEFGP
jgi:hypothetical protein